MSEFDLTTVSFSVEDFQGTMEDKFSVAKLKQGIENTDSKQELKQIACTLAELATQRQSLIRGLCRRLAKFESELISRSYEDKLKAAHKDG